MTVQHVSAQCKPPTLCSNKELPIWVQDSHLQPPPPQPQTKNAGKEM